MGKKKEIEQIQTGGYLISGLPQKTPKGFFVIRFEGNNLKLIEEAGAFRRKEYQSFLLDIAKIISIDLITQDNLVEKQNSTVGRGVAGAILFGPIGAIIGTSSAGSTTTTEKTGVIVISYYGKDEQDIKTINLSVWEDGMKYVRNFITYFQKHYRGEFQEQNENGDIIL